MMAEAPVEAAAGEAPSLEAAPPVPTVGERLRAERERQGLSVHDVAQRLKYAPRQIEAIEADDFKALPGLTFVRGFVRGYARVLGIEGDGLVRLLETSAEHASALTMVQFQEVSGKREQFPTDGGSHKSALPWLLAILLVVGAFGGYSVYNWQAPEEFLQPAPVRAPTAPDTTATASLPVMPASQDAGSPQPASPQADASASGQVPAEVGLPAQANSPQGAAAQARIRLVFAGESWTELRDGEGKVLLSRRNTPGSEQTTEGTPPFEVVVGNAREVKLFYNGAEFDMSPYIKVSVARFQLK
jgi:cytoskeleton protein RodZ